MVFFPADHPIPDLLQTPTFVLRQLREAVAPIDFEAFKGSPDVIRIHSGGQWPVETYTLEQEKRELALHEVRHRERRDFAFIILSPDETTGLGCVYILPLIPHLRSMAVPDAVMEEVTDANAIVTFWLRQDRQSTALASEVITAVHDWMLAEWPFDDHVVRVNPQEDASIQALEQCGFHVRFDLTMDKPPFRYLFFAKTSNPS